MLNDGKLRDADGIDARNPRPPRRTWKGAAKKPVAVNVVVIDTADPGKESLTQLRLIAQAQRGGGDPESAGRNAADRGGDPL
jgi:hypothetical protein